MSYDDLNQDCWETVISFVRNPANIESISSTCKEFLDISNRSRCNAIAYSLTALTHIVDRFKRLRSIELSMLEIDEAFSYLANCELPSLRSLITLETEFRDSIYDKILPLAAMRKLGTSAPGLTCLDCSQFSLRDDDVAVITESFQYLKQLNVANTAYFLPKQLLTDSSVQSIAKNCTGILRLDISGHSNLSDRSMEALAARCKDLISLSISNCTGITAEGIARVATECSLQELIAADLTNIITFTLIQRIMTHTSNKLEALDFCGTKMSSKMYDALGTSCIQFKKLAFSGQDGLPSLVKLLQQECCSQLMHLELRRMPINEKDMLLLLKNLRNLKSICLSGCINLTETTFFQVMTTCREMVEIDMENTSLGKPGAIINNLNPSTSLKRLRIGENNIGDEELERIAATCSNLESLDVHNSRISDVGIGQIRNMCSKLYHLNVSQCMRIRTLGTSSFSQLRILNAGMSGLTDEGVVRLAGECNLLEDVVFEGTNVTDAGIEEFEKRCSKRLKRMVTDSFY